MATYPFVQGIDYGPRKGTEGFAFHMTEGNGGYGDVAYLARRPGETIAEWHERVRGVSANFVIIDDGRIFQMVGWTRASGSMNPRNQSDSAGFYRQSFINQVLGIHEADPNAYSLSCEVAGKRAVGPTDAQVRSMIALVADARSRFPSLRGAYGHADQTDTKECPGTSPNMLRFWNTVGHGLFLPDTAGEGGGTGGTDMAISTRGLTLISHHAVSLPDGTKVYEYPEAGSPVIGEFTGPVAYFGAVNGYKAVRVSGPEGTVIGYTGTSASVWDNPPATVDEKAIFNQGVAAASAAAKTATKP